MVIREGEEMSKALNLTQEELVTMVGLIRDGMLHRQLREVRNHGTCSVRNEKEQFLLDYAQAQAGYTVRMSPELLERLGITG